MARAETRGLPPGAKRKTGLDFSVHLSVNRKRRNTKTSEIAIYDERRTQMTQQTTTNTRDERPAVLEAVPATALDGQTGTGAIAIFYGAAATPSS